MSAPTATREITIEADGDGYVIADRRDPDGHGFILYTPIASPDRISAGEWFAMGCAVSAAAQLLYVLFA